MQLFDDVEIQRTGKDELNLVELPFTALTTKPVPDAVIENEWVARHPINNRAVKASWRVVGDPERGLPNSTDEKVYLALMELTREQGMQRTVTFTRYDLVKRLGWTLGKQSYQQLMDSLERLTSVTITSRNAFWDKKAQAFVSTGFHILDEYKIFSGQAGEGDNSPSYFKWSDTIHANLEAGYIRSIDLGFAYSLGLPLSLRLYRYLHKKSHDGKRIFEIELQRLCEVHLGMAPCKYPSQLKQRLKNAHEELIARGFLHAVEYDKMRSKESSEKVRYIFRPELIPLPPVEAKKGDGEALTGVGEAPAPQDTQRYTPERAAALKAIYDALPADEQTRLLEEAKASTGDMFWPRLTNPESPASFALWDLVERDHQS
jgi:plasmid replication initiation protein